MGPIIVIGVATLVTLWYLGILTPSRLRIVGAVTVALVALRILAMGRPLVAGGLFALGGWLYWSTKTKPAGDRLAEARRLLGVAANAGEAEINAAYRARMAELHPDRGGSDEAASAVNAARDTLIEHAARRRPR